MIVETVAAPLIETIVETLLVGLLVGLVLGATGAGGSIFAVPLFIIFLDLSANDAMGVALGAVSTAALVGILMRNNRQDLAWKPGLLLAISGAMTAPIGRWLGSQIDETLLLSGFSLLACILALRMWLQASTDPSATYAVRGDIQSAHPDLETHSTSKPASNSDATTKQMRSTGLIASGLVIGMLSGLFGVGGGFLIVPLLTLVTAMAIKKAVGTSLIVISLVSAAGFITHLLTTAQAEPIPTEILLYTCSGSIIGIISGTLLCHKISGPKLQKLFAVSVVALMATSLIQQYI